MKPHAPEQPGRQAPESLSLQRRSRPALAGLNVDDTVLSPTEMRLLAAQSDGNGASNSKMSTRERILLAFLQVANDRGLEAATTRRIAQAAGVNEVTLFRHFADKANLSLVAIRHFSPVESIRGRDPQIDVSSPSRAAAGLEACLRCCSDGISARQELLVFGVGEARRMPEVLAEMAAIPRAAMEFLGRALTEAAAVLRPEIDHRATTLQWLGLLVNNRLLVARGVIAEPSAEEWDQLLAAAVRAVIDWRGDENDVEA